MANFKGLNDNNIFLLILFCYKQNSGHSAQPCVPPRQQHLQEMVYGNACPKVLTFIISLNNQNTSNFLPDLFLVMLPKPSLFLFSAHYNL